MTPKPNQKQPQPDPDVEDDESDADGAAGPCFYVFWSINGALDLDRLTEQLDLFEEAGYDGVVWHPRFYPNEPPYLSDAYMQVLDAVILAAAERGLEFWMYDENGWPAGTVGGELPRRFPQFRDQWLELREGTPSPTEDIISTFLLPPDRPDGEERQVRWVRVRGTGMDFLNPAATQTFLEMTHERLRAGLSAAAWDTVTTFFTDEPALLSHDAYGEGKIVLPWTDRLPQRYREQYGEDLLELLPSLLLPRHGHGDVRVRFWELCSDMLRDGFMKPYAEWCRAHGKEFTGHAKGEEHPLFQVPMNGGYQTTLPLFTLPGIDSLERGTHGDFYPRQAASVAAQFGDGRAMAECFGGSGWGATPEDLERYLRWLGGNGITHFVLHLCQYQLNTAAIQDWPPSLPLHMSWREVMPHVLDAVRESLAETAPLDLSEEDEARRILLVAPYRAIMAGFDPSQLATTDIHKGATYPDSSAAEVNRRFLDAVARLKDSGHPWHVVDERTLDFRGTTTGGQLHIGQVAYSTVYLSQDCRLSRPGNAMMEQFAKDGGKLLRRSGELPTAPFVQVATASETFIDAQITWEPVAPVDNAYVPTLQAEGDGWFRFDFVADGGVSLEAICVDPVHAATLNGAELEVTPAGRLRLLDLPAASLRPGPATNQVRLHCPTRQTPPFVSLLGRFRALNQGAWSLAANGCDRADGPWRLAAPAPVSHPGELHRDGYPFMFRPLLLVGRFSTRRVHSVVQVQIPDIHADAAYVAIDGEELGWIWGQGFAVDWETRLPPGPHSIELEIVPSTYNFYGPHHHYEGDRHVVSPGQYSGKRNFADSPGAPEMTHLPAWHFRPFGVKPTVRLLPPRRAESD